MSEIYTGPAREQSVSMDPKIVYPGCNTRMEIELAYDLGRREGQVEWLRAQLRASLAQLTGRHPGGQRLAISGASAILRQALAVSEPWEAPTK